MKRGIWHQMGDKSQKLVLEQIKSGAGVGIIISPRDLPFENASKYAVQYRDLGAEVLVDQQFYVPTYTNDSVDSYPLQEYRTSVSQLAKLNPLSSNTLIEGLVTINGVLGSSALIAPAIVYEIGRQDIVETNARLFSCAKIASKELGIPCYATVILGSSATVGDHTVLSVLSDATSLDADGWYFGYSFPQAERIPSLYEDVYRCGRASLTLACTGQPVLHAFAGPMSILSPGFAATAAGIGHAHNMWQFTPQRWHQSTGRGGGGDAPARFFSTILWGTIIYPDELAALPQDIRNDVLTGSPFSGPVVAAQKWSRWEANKHLVYLISSSLQPLFETTDPRTAVNYASEVLTKATEIHTSIRMNRIHLHDNTDSYQSNWNRALQNLLQNEEKDYNFIEAIKD